MSERNIAEQLRSISGGSAVVFVTLAAADEIERLRAALALADHVVDSLRDVFDPSLSEETHDTIFGVWQEAQKALTAYEAARHDR